MDYGPIQHTELVQRYKNGANWFYWIAGLTIVTSLIAFAGGGIAFIFSLGSTQIIDGVAIALSTELGSAAKVVALFLDLIVTAIFAGFGWLANKKYLWAYILGMVAFLLDGVVSLVVQDWISVLAHGFVLYFLFRGVMAGPELLNLEKAMAEQQKAAPQPEPAI